MSRIKFIAEAGQTMRGDVGLAVEMVYAFAEVGATHFKVQMLNPDELVVKERALSYWNTSQSIEQHASFVNNGVIRHHDWAKVRGACADAGIGFVATPFDIEAVHALADLQPAAVKIASGDITFLPLLREISVVMHPKVPILLSTGASDGIEIMLAMEQLKRYRSAEQQRATTIVPMACTLAYPTKLTDTNLGRIHFLMSIAADVGYSDHTLGVETAFGAVAAGASWLEKHVSPNPIHPSSMSPVGPDAVPDDAMALGASEFNQYVDNGLMAEVFVGSDAFIIEAERPARYGARRAARFAHDIPAGHLVEPADCTFLRPDPTGDGASVILACAGVTTTRDVVAGEVLTEENCR